MGKYIEHKIGDIFYISETVKLKTVPDPCENCINCYYRSPIGKQTCNTNEHDRELCGHCYSSARNDNKNVKFIKVK